VTPRAISERSQHDPETLRTDDTIEGAIRRLLDSDLPALPVSDPAGRFAGIFGEREFLRALFPGYVDQLKGAAFLRRSLDETLEKRDACRAELVEAHMNTEHVDVAPDHSDIQLAEIFLHHRVVMIPIVDAGRVTGVITRTAFFEALAARFLGDAAPG
jgi:CBS domain-containing protein